MRRPDIEFRRQEWSGGLQKLFADWEKLAAENGIDAKAADKFGSVLRKKRQSIRHLTQALNAAYKENSAAGKKLKVGIYTRGPGGQVWLGASSMNGLLVLLSFKGDVIGERELMGGGAAEEREEDEVDMEAAE